VTSEKPADLPKESRFQIGKPNTLMLFQQHLFLQKLTAPKTLRISKGLPELKTGNRSGTKPQPGLINQQRKKPLLKNV